MFGRALRAGFRAAKLSGRGPIRTARAESTPAWRAAMTVTDRIYNVSTASPGITPGLLPNPVAAHYLGNSESPNFGNGTEVMGGYSCGTLLESEGTYGTLVVGSGGHTVIANQALGLPLSDDAPAFEWFRQPEYVTSDTAGANLYYAPAEVTALLAGGRGSAAVIDMANEAASSAAWDRAFPVGTSTGWIFPRKMTTGEMGNFAPHGYRYGSNCYVSAVVTGSDPIWLVGGPRPQGPFALAERPSGTTLAEWFNAANIYASGRRKWPFHALNLRTGAWSIIANYPDVDTSLFQGTVFVTDPSSRRVYASFENTQNCTFYLDFTGGLGAVTVSAVTSAATSGSHGRYPNCVGALTVGHPTKLLWYWPDSGSFSGVGLYIQDVLAGTTASVDLTAAGLALTIGNEAMGTMYDAANNRLLFVQPVNVSDPAAGFEYFVVNVPDGDHTNAANYTVSKRTLTMDASVTTMTDAALLAQFYGKTRIHPTLGTCLIPFARNRTLGFNPS